MRTAVNKMVVTWIIVAYALCVDHGLAQLKFPRPSQSASVSQTIGITNITITYSRPGVKGRVIWGGLVPYDTIWRTGANENTTISVSDTVRVEGKILPAGTYSLSTIPGKSSWTVILNKRSDLWGTNGYSKDDDALRFEVKPEQSAENQEWMRFSFEDLKENSCQIVLAWEKVRVPIKLDVETRSIVFAKARAALGWQQASQAASYALQSKSNLDEAMKWIDMSMMATENYFNMRLKAQLLAELGKKNEAITLMERALARGKEMKDRPNDLTQMEQKLKDWKKQ